MSYRHEAHMIDTVGKISSGANASDVLEASQLGKAARLEAYRRAQTVLALSILGRQAEEEMQAVVDIVLPDERRKKPR